MKKISKEKREALLAEYSEAGDTCRANDKLVRTGITIFVTAQAAIIGFIKTQTGTTVAREIILLEWLGFVVSVATWINILRLQALYSVYIERAKCIEGQLELNLYSAAVPALSGMKIPGEKIGNKKLLAALPATSFAIYSVLLFEDAPKYFTLEKIYASLPEAILFLLMLGGFLFFFSGGHGRFEHIWSKCKKGWTLTTGRPQRRRAPVS